MTEAQQLQRELERAGLIRRLAGGGRAGCGAYPTVANGPARAIVPHVAGARLVLLAPGSAHCLAEWLSIAPGGEGDERVARYLTLWGQ